MTEQDPTRLTEQAAASPDLKGALEALGQTGADAERLLRVAGKLSAVLDAPPPALPVATHIWRFGLRQLTAGKLTVALLLVGGSFWFAAAWLSHEPPASQRALERPSQDMPVAQPDRPREPGSVSPAAPVQVQPVVVAPDRLDVTAEPAAQPATRVEPQPTKRRVTSAARAAKAQPSATAAPAPSVTHDSLVSARPPAPDAPPPPVAQARPRTEAELLFEARKALAERPRAALTLLEQHAQLYPHGQLAPEREVLAIEALRKLGDDEAAEARARRFRSEYPGSFHLKGLE